MSRSPWRDVPAYRQIINSRLRTTLAYRQNVFFLLAILILQIFILRKVWTALYQGHTTVDGLTLHALLVYITLANLQNWVLQDPTISFYMYNRVREGQVAFDLVRPVGFVPQMFAHLVGSSFATVIFGLVALPFIFFAGTLGAPASPTALLLYLASFVLGYVITTLLTLMLGMFAFWTTEISGLTMLYRLINQFFAGALVPVSLFPGADSHHRGRAAVPGDDLHAGRNLCGPRARYRCAGSAWRPGSVGRPADLRIMGDVATRIASRRGAGRVSRR